MPKLMTIRLTEARKREVELAREFLIRELRDNQAWPSDHESAELREGAECKVLVKALEHCARQQRRHKRDGLLQVGLLRR